MKVQVFQGDIAQVPVDALIAAINSGGMWFGGIDGVIRRCAGPQFHNQAADALDFDRNTKVVVAPWRYRHEGQFQNVVFAIDDVNEPLEDVVRRGLDAAALAGFKTVSMPAIRLGVMKDLGGTQAEKVRDIVNAIREHEKAMENPLREITIVIYDDSALAQDFIRALA